MDRCEFCNAAIPFTDLTTATCLNGHQFPRCGLSFIAIQAPGITKYCGICSTPFFSEELVAAQERGHMMVNSEVQENGMTDQKMTNGELSETGGDRRSVEEKGGIRPTLAQLLFFACDACIYCGGKFIG